MKSEQWKKIMAITMVKFQKLKVINYYLIQVFFVPPSYIKWFFLCVE